jgi:hypothetical protein
MKHTIRQPLLIAMALAALVAVVAAAPATAATSDQILRDCIAHDGLHGHYKRSELQRAKSNVTGDRLAYSECLAEISAAMNKKTVHASTPGAGSGGNGSKQNLDRNGDGVVTPAEKRAAKEAQQTREDGVADANDALQQDAGGVAGGGSSGGDGGGGLGLVLAIAALALLAIAAATWYAARRNPAIANALRRVPLPGRHS